MLTREKIDVSVFGAEVGSLGDVGCEDSVTGAGFSAGDTDRSSDFGWV